MGATLSAVIIKKDVHDNIIKYSNIKVMDGLLIIPEQIYGHVSSLAIKNRKQIQKFNKRHICR